MIVVVISLADNYFEIVIITMDDVPIGIYFEVVTMNFTHIIYFANENSAAVAVNNIIVNSNVHVSKN